VYSRSDLRKTGVYAIRRLESGQKYIGSTSVSFKERWYKHTHSLDSGTHHNEHLQRAWIKYGEDAFIFEVIEIVAPSRCLEREQEILDHLWNSGLLYNVNPVVDRPTMSEDGLQRMTAAARDRGLKNREAFIQRVKELWNDPQYRSRMGATKELWLDPGFRKRRADSHIKGVNTPEYRSRRSDLTFRQWAKPGYREKRSVDTKELWNDPVFRQRFRDGMGIIPRYVRDSDGQIHEVWEVRTFAREHGLHIGKLHGVLSGKRRHHKGWTLVKDLSCQTSQ